MTFKQLFAGEVNYIVELPVGAGEFKIGTLLVSTDGKTWAPATAESAVIDNHFAISAEDKTATGADILIGYMEGYFNRNVVEVDGAEASDDVVEILKTKKIFIKDTITE